MIIFGRKVMKVGTSLCITLPKSITKTYNIKKGDYLNIVAGVVDGFLLIDLKKSDIEALKRELREL